VIDLQRVRKLNNFDVDATAGGLWDDTTHYIATVPAGKRWILLGGVINRDVSATVKAYARDVSGNIILKMGDEAAGTGYSHYPETAFWIGTPLVLDSSEDVYLQFNVAQGGSAWATCVVLEVSI